MMKKILFYFAAVCTMAFAVSCQQEKLDAPAANDRDLVEVTFELSANDLQTKGVIGHDPTFIKDLKVGVYRNGNYLPEVKPKVSEEFGRGLTAKVSVVLVKGQTYDIAFWADHTGNPYYEVDFTAGQPGKNFPLVTVDYNEGEANNIYRDAWCAVKSHHVTDDSSKGVSVTLNRPFAQINVGTRDYKLAQKAGVTVTASSMKIVGVPDQLNMFTGETFNSTANTEVLFERSAIPGGTLTVYYNDETKTAEYDYLSMNYILVSNQANSDKGLVEVYIDFYEDGNDVRINDEIKVVSVPVRANYRTNLIADDVLTQAFDFNVVIDPNFDGEFTGWNPNYDKVEYPEKQ